MLLHWLVPRNWPRVKVRLISLVTSWKQALRYFHYLPFCLVPPTSQYSISRLHLKAQCIHGHCAHPAGSASVLSHKKTQVAQLRIPELDFFNSFYLCFAVSWTLHYSDNGYVNMDLFLSWVFFSTIHTNEGCGKSQKLSGVTVIIIIFHRSQRDMSTPRSAVFVNFSVWNAIFPRFVLFQWKIHMTSSFEFRDNEQKPNPQWNWPMNFTARFFLFFAFATNTE